MLALPTSNCPLRHSSEHHQSQNARRGQYWKSINRFLPISHQSHTFFLITEGNRVSFRPPNTRKFSPEPNRQAAFTTGTEAAKHIVSTYRSPTAFPNKTAQLMATEIVTCDRRFLLSQHAQCETLTTGGLAAHHGCGTNYTWGLWSEERGGFQPFEDIYQPNGTHSGIFAPETGTPLSMQFSTLP